MRTLNLVFFNNSWFVDLPCTGLDINSLRLVTETSRFITEHAPAGARVLTIAIDLNDNEESTGAPFTRGEQDAEGCWYTAFNGDRVYFSDTLASIYGTYPGKFYVFYD